MIFMCCNPIDVLRTFIKACVFRFLHEGLDNACQYAGANGQKVESHLAGGMGNECSGSSAPQLAFKRN
ncbi:hypothetical protein N185_17080 [Sinorhizobium sp. GW3]|nr:hypothetical protein N185_17080 [Sinorhizobium sp. GW3]